MKTPLHSQASTPLCVRPAPKSCDLTAVFHKGDHRHTLDFDKKLI